MVLDNLVIDRILYGIATKSKTVDGHEYSKVPQYVLTQLSEATINITADSQDATDAQGNIVKRFWKSKQGEFTATNAMLNLSIIGAMSGENKFTVSSGVISGDTELKEIIAPKIKVVTGDTLNVTLERFAGEGYASLVSVAAITNSGTQTKAYLLSDGGTADADHFVVTSTGALTLPKETDNAIPDKYLIKYFCKVQNGGMIRNRADKFPGTVELTLKCLAVDPCAPDVLKGLYVVFPSFQPSPETEVNLQTEGTLDFNGQLQVDYCGDEKVLYYMYWDDEDAED